MELFSIIALVKGLIEECQKYTYLRALTERWVSNPQYNLILNYMIKTSVSATGQSGIYSKLALGHLNSVAEAISLNLDFCNVWFYTNKRKPLGQFQTGSKINILIFEDLTFSVEGLRQSVLPATPAAATVTSAPSAALPVTKRRKHMPEGGYIKPCRQSPTASVSSTRVATVSYNQR